MGCGGGGSEWWRKIGRRKAKLLWSLGRKQARKQNVKQAGCTVPGEQTEQAGEKAPPLQLAWQLSRGL